MRIILSGLLIFAVALIFWWQNRVSSPLKRMPGFGGAKTVTVDFGKKFDLGILEDLLELDRREIIEYAQKLGIKVYRFPGSEGGGQVDNDLSNIELAPQAILERVLTLEEDIGRFFWYSDLGPILLIRENLNKIQLIHELMHYSSAKYETVRIDEFRDHLMTVVREANQKRSLCIKSLREQRADHCMESVTLFHQVGMMTVESIPNSKFEEAIINQLILDYSARGRLEITKAEREDALNYARDSLNKGLDLVRKTQRLLKTTRDVFEIARPILDPIEYKVSMDKLSEASSQLNQLYDRGIEYRNSHFPKFDQSH